LFKNGGYDFVANNLVPTFPHGLDAEVMSRGTLAIADSKATSAYDREHVTPWIPRAGAGVPIFRICNLPCPMDLSAYRLTVDYLEDLEVIRAIYEHFHGSPFIQIPAVTAFLDSRPDLMALNAKYRKPVMAVGEA
jgi:spore coat polysaccharide biosynthesis protein SpsF (cytidylyltransferase family)